MDLFNSFIVLFALFNLLIGDSRQSSEENQDAEVAPQYDGGDGTQQNDNETVTEDTRLDENVGLDEDVGPPDNNDRVKQYFHGDNVRDDDDSKQQDDVLSPDNERVLLAQINRAIKGVNEESWIAGYVPYIIDNNSYDAIIYRRIRVAMNKIEDSSCVKFWEKKNMEDTSKVHNKWIYITNPKQERECTHRLDMGLEGRATLVLGFDCMQYRQILHSLMHALGFRDEVTHPQRDHFVRVMWENIRPKYRPLFRINPSQLPIKTMVEYDTMSIMQFHDRQFTINGNPTLMPVIPGLLINPTDDLSQLDLMKLRLAFGPQCNKRKVDDVLKTCKDIMKASPPDQSNTVPPAISPVPQSTTDANQVTAAEGTIIKNIPAISASESDEPNKSIEPIEPSETSESSEPIEPIESSESSESSEPIESSESIEPIEPIEPIAPSE